jgi:hypothetical protein
MKQSINNIKKNKWELIDPLHLIHVGFFFAREFAATGRDCIPIYYDIQAFRQFIEGEIDTDNLAYDDYNQKGDHWEFLAHFIKKIHRKNRQRIFLPEWMTDMEKKYEFYANHVRSYTIAEKLATLVSRERELHGIFEHILTAHDWDALGYGFYKYFLQRHIQLDTEDRGHGEITADLIDLEFHQDALTAFWYYRWRVYQSLT